MNRHALWVLAATLLVLVALPGTAAADCMDEAGELTSQDVQAVADAYNENADDLPGFVSGQIAGERVELRVTGDTAIVYTVVFDDNARAVAVTEGVDDPTLRVTVASATLCDALQSENPAATLVGAYESGELTIEGVGTANALKVTLVKTAIGIAQFFGLV